LFVRLGWTQGKGTEKKNVPSLQWYNRRGRGWLGPFIWAFRLIASPRMLPIWVQNLFTLINEAATKGFFFFPLFLF